MVPRGWRSTRNFRFFNETGFLNQFRKPGVWLLYSWDRMGNSLNFICLAKLFFSTCGFLFGNFQPKLYDHLILQWGIKSWWFWWRSMLSSKFVPLPVDKWPGVFTACKCRVIYNFIYNHSLELAFFFHRQASDLVLWVGRGSLASLFKTLNLARSPMGCVRCVVGRVPSRGLSAYGSFWCFILGYVSVMGLGQFYRSWVDRDG